MYQRFVKLNYVLSLIHSHGMRLHCFFIVNSPVNAARSSLNGVCQWKFHGKRIKLKTFPQGYKNQPLWCSVKVDLRRPNVLGSSPIQYRIVFPSFFFFPVFLLLFSINIYLNNCYLIKFNKEQEKHPVSREKIVHCILNIWINNLNFYHFLQFTAGKLELITI